MTRRLALLLALAAITLPAAAAEAQNAPRSAPRRRDTIDVLADTARLARRAATATAVRDRFFRDTTPLELTLTVNSRQIRGDRQDGAPWRRGTISYSANGETVSVPLQVRTRGIWRLKNCGFPPLRLNIAERTAKGTIFEGVDRPKFVGVCDDDDRSERYVLQEYQLYRVHNLLSEASHGARLTKVTWMDSASRRPLYTRWGFIVEEPEAVAARLRGALMEQQGARGRDLEPVENAMMGVFQYFIGNTDWSVSGLHNIELVRVDYGVHVPVAYDFDYAGAVDAHYARPPQQLAIRRVTDRVYRGDCTPPGHMERAVRIMHEKKDAIYALYDDSIGRRLPANTIRTTLAFFDQFYRDTSTPAGVKRRIVDACLDG